MTKYSKVEQMGDEMFETKWFLGSLRASQAIKKGKKVPSKMISPQCVQVVAIKYTYLAPSCQCQGFVKWCPLLT